MMHRFMERLLSRVCDPAAVEHIIGDLSEIRLELNARFAKPLATLLFALEALRFLRPAFLRRPAAAFIPPRTVRTAIRSLRTHAGLSGLNLVGLSIGVAACLGIMTWVQSERSVDQHHPHANQTVRLIMESGGHATSTLSSAALAPALEDAVPSIQSWTRLFKHWERPYIQRGTSGRIEPAFYFADSTFFDVFAYEFVAGTPRTALKAPHSVVLTESAAHRLFGTDDPVGQHLSYNSEHELTVTGVVRDPAFRSHLRPEFIASLSTLPKVSYARILEEWSVFVSYAVLAPGTDPGVFERQATDLVRSGGGDDRVSVHAQPVTSIHLHSRLTNELEANGDARFVWLMMVLGGMILAIACINYVNISTAQSSRRQREIGVRKSLGALRSQLIIQFTSEAAALSLLSIVLGVLAVVLVSNTYGYELGLPAVSAAGMQRLGSWAVGLWALCTLGAGLYPAFTLSRFAPSRALKGVDVGVGHGQRARNILVVLQFTACLVLLMGTWSVRNQLNYVRHSNLGFSPEAVLTVPVQDGGLRARMAALKDGWMANAGVVAVGASSSTVPGQPHSGGHVVIRPGQAPSDGVRLQRNWIDASYIDALAIDLIAGRSFDEGSATNASRVLINETAARQLGWESPEEAVGASIILDGESLEIAGVSSDYHFESLHNAVGPLLLSFNTFSTQAVVRIQTDDVDGTLAAMETVWTQLTDQSFSPVFLDDNLDALYQADRRWGRMMVIASLLAVLVACLGLIGLALFMTEMRTRELGIRKVHGATTGQLVVMLTGTFIKLVVAAIVIALPIAWVTGAQWKADFAYAAPTSALTFIVPSLLALFVAGLTVSFHTLRAARKSPVDCLRS